VLELSKRFDLLLSPVLLREAALLSHVLSQEEDAVSEEMCAHLRIVHSLMHGLQRALGISGTLARPMVRHASVPCLEDPAYQQQQQQQALGTSRPRPMVRMTMGN
jgi:hypothetical protein